MIINTDRLREEIRTASEFNTDDEKYVRIIEDWYKMLVLSKESSEMAKCPMCFGVNPSLCPDCGGSGIDSRAS